MVGRDIPGNPRYGGDWGRRRWRGLNRVTHTRTRTRKHSLAHIIAATASDTVPKRNTTLKRFAHGKF